MPNENIGTIKCPITGAQAQIRKAKRGKYPLYWYSRESGIIHGKTPEFEQFIKQHGRFSEPDEAPQPQKSPEPDNTGDDDDWLI